MPATISHLCPYCHHENIVFTVVAEALSKDDPTLIHTLATCGACDKPAAVTFRKTTHQTLMPLQYTGNYKTRHHSAPPLELVAFQPKYSPKEPPKHLPNPVHRAFEQACSNADRHNLTPAVMMLRKTIELGIQHAFPDMSGKLARNIHQLGAENIIPRAMLDWVDEIRLLGNEGAHDEMLDDGCLATRAEVQQAIAFADMFLTYAFTMPKEVALRRAKHRPPHCL